MKKLYILSIALLVSMFTPGSLLAQSSSTAADNEPAISIDPNLQVVTTQEEKDVNVIVTVVNKNTGYVLGGVKIDFGEIKTVITQDPPVPEGETIYGIKSGEREIIANRAGYILFDQKMTLSSDLKNTILKIEMEPAPGTPRIDQYIQQNNMVGQNNYSSWPNINSNNIQNYQAMNSPQTVYNPNNLSQNYGNNYNSPYENGMPNYNTAMNNGSFPNQYYQNQNQRYANPVKITLRSLYSNNLNLNNLDSVKINIYDRQTGQMVISKTSSFSSFNTFENQNIYVCLQPQKQYVVEVTNASFGSVGSYLSNQTKMAEFVTGQAGQSMEIIITSTEGVNSLMPMDRYSINLNQNGIGQFNNYNCQMDNQFQTTGNGYGSGNYGSTVFNSDTINLQQLQNTYQIGRDNYGNYLLYNKQNQFDQRPFYFVDRGDGRGGLVFLPSQTSNSNFNNMNSNTESSWYVTAYTREPETGNIKFTPEVFSRVSMTPSQYAYAVRGQMTGNFNGTINYQGSESLNQFNQVSSNNGISPQNNTFQNNNIYQTTLSGEILDEQSRPMPGVLVKIIEKGNENNVLFMQRTDNSGKFRFGWNDTSVLNPNKAKDIILVNSSGQIYRNIVQNFAIDIGQNNVLNIKFTRTTQS